MKPRKIIIEVQGGCLVGLFADKSLNITAELIDWDNLKEELSQEDYEAKERATEFHRLSMRGIPIK